MTTDRNTKGQFYKGFEPWNKGKKLKYAGHAKPHTAAAKRRISEARKGKMIGASNHNFGGLKPGVAEKISKKLKGRKLSPRHLAKIRRAMKKLSGKNSPSWQTVKLSKDRKYRHIKCPPEFMQMAKKDGMVLLHRLLMAQKLGRPLTRKEVIDHINRDTLDNRLENLRLYASNAEHLADTMRKGASQNFLREAARIIKTPGYRSFKDVYKKDFATIRPQEE